MIEILPDRDDTDINYMTSITYTGQFVYGEKHGRGIETYRYKDGSQIEYEGDFRNNKKHGYGIVTSVWEEKWEHGQRIR